LNEYVPSEVIHNCNALLSPKSWILCEKQIAEIDEFVFKNGQERLFFDNIGTIKAKMWNWN
jgi:hypothetical protein